MSGTPRRDPHGVSVVTPGPFEGSEGDADVSRRRRASTGAQLDLLSNVHRREISERLAPLVTLEVVEEHRRAPSGHHSPALAQILTYLRQAPTTGKLAAYAVVPGRQWQIVRLSGVQGSEHDTSDPGRYDSEAGVAHEIFLRRLNELALWPPRRDV